MTTTDDDRCHWSKDTEQRVLRRHVRGCTLAGCEGCEPCPQAHCSMPRCNHHLREHEPHVCDRCVGKVRDDLTRLVQLCGFAPYVAATQLGGAAFASAVTTLVGPVPEHSTHYARHEYALGGALCRCAPGMCPDRQPEPVGPTCERWKDCVHLVCRRLTGRPACPALVDWLDLADDEKHPLWVLGAWDEMVARHLGHTRNLRVTIKSSAAYLDANLTDLARLVDFGFDDLAREVSVTLAHVESVLLLALREEEGAPCPVCFAQGRRAKPLVRHFNEFDTSGVSDRWRCPVAICAQEWTPKEYATYVESESLQHADRLTASDIAKVYRVPEGTVRRWAHEGRVRRCGYDGQRRQLYDVADVKARRLDPPGVAQ
jgi:hypothetical protein